MPDGTDDPINTTIQSLQTDKMISDKLAFYCYQSGIYTIRDLLLYQLRSFHFIPVPGSTNEDTMVLKRLCYQLLNTLPRSENASSRESGSSSNDEAWNVWIDDQLQPLSVRAKNVIRVIRNDLKAPKAFLTYLLANKHRLVTLNKIGRKTATEMLHWIEMLEPMLQDPGQPPPKESYNKIARLLTEEINLPQSVADELILMHSKEQPILVPLLNALYRNSNRWTKNTRQVINELADPKYDSQHLNFSQLGRTLAITPERVRQIEHQVRIKLQHIIHAVLQFIPANTFLAPYPILTADQIIIDSTLAKTMNAHTSTPLSIRLIAVGVMAVREGKMELYFSKKQNAYLSNPDIFPIAGLETILIWAEAHLGKKRSSQMLLDVEKIFFSPTWLMNEPKKLSVRNFIKQALEIEFDLHMDSLNELELPANKKKKKPELMIDILEAHGRPMRLTEILEQLHIRHPEMKIMPKGLRSSLINHERVISFSRTSTYGLKDWESEENHIKGGSLRDMVIEFLMGHEAPVHRKEVMNYIHKYRTVTWNNLQTNLKLDSHNRFLFFEKGFIGLAAKSYPGWEKESK